MTGRKAAQIDAASWASRGARAAYAVWRMTRIRWLAVLLLVSATFAVALAGGDSMLRCLWPALVAVGVIMLTRHAAVGLACGVLTAGLLLADGGVVRALRLVLADHFFPSLEGPWRTGALVFTLVLGSFAGVLERSGGFEAVLGKLLGGRRDGSRHLLGGVFGVGVLCFFDGLASSLLSGRLARPFADRAGVSRERLAWVVDSTGSPVACVAFISTWIATQLSLIEQGLKDAPFRAEPYAMFFGSVPANAYCLLTLLLVVAAIGFDYQPRAMRRFRASDPETSGGVARPTAPPWVVLVPLAVLVLAIFAGFPLLSAERPDVTKLEGWKTAFGGDSGPYAMVFGSVAGLMAAMACFPAKRRGEAVAAAGHGAGSLIPSLVVLVLAWTLGSMFVALGTTERISEMLTDGKPVQWLPLAVFVTGGLMAFTTGSSWGTMGLLMPLALPAAVSAAVASGLPVDEVRDLAMMIIGAVFGGATLGDHCSPFSDTTIVSALASGCRTTDHVVSQLPFAAMAAAAACAAYSLMAVRAEPVVATAVAGLALVAWVAILKKLQNRKC